MGCANHLYAIAIGSNRRHVAYGRPTGVIAAAIAELDAFHRLPEPNPVDEHGLVPSGSVLEGRAAGGELAEIQSRQGAHLDRVGVGGLLLAGRIGRHPVRRGLLDNLLANRLVEAQDDPGHLFDAEPLEPLELEDRGFEPKHQARIGGRREAFGPRPARRPFAAPKEGG